MARDFYNDGFNDGYGFDIGYRDEYPNTEMDRYSYKRGVEDGVRRRTISEELDREYFND